MTHQLIDIGTTSTTLEATTGLPALFLEKTSRRNRFAAVEKEKGKRIPY